MLIFSNPSRLHMLRLRRGLALGALTLVLAGCGSTKWGFPYRADIQQGNWLTTEQVAQLRPGLTRDQVRYLLGSPTLQDIFRDNRWDYPYYNKPGYGKTQKRLFSVWFEGDQLVRWAGDEQPDRQPFQSSDTGMGGKPASDDRPAPEAAPPAPTGAPPEPQPLP